jgi:hypothetical protein
MDTGNLLVVIGALFILATVILTIVTFTSSLKSQAMPWLITFIMGVLLIIIGLVIGN